MTTLYHLSIGPESIAGLTAIFGSPVGALGSSTSTWSTHRRQERRKLLAQKIVRRETLYSNFINESARLLIMAMGSEQAGLTGFKRSIVRKVAGDRSASSLRESVTAV